MMSAKAKKFQDGDQSTRLYTTVSPQQRHFKKKSPQFFIRRTHNHWSNQESKTKYSPRLQGNRHTDRHTDRQTHTQTHTYTHTHTHTIGVGTMGARGPWPPHFLETIVKTMAKVNKICDWPPHLDICPNASAHTHTHTHTHTQCFDYC